MLDPKRNAIEYQGYLLKRVHDFSVFSGFSCGDEDLDEYIRKDAHEHRIELVAETYQLTLSADEGIGGIPDAFVSFSNDAIKLTPSQKDDLPEQMRKYKQMPAVKIARVGVRQELQGQNIGSTLLDICKFIFITNNRTGCRFLTVDAYNRDITLNFYEKNGFHYYTHKDIKKRQRIMMFDLKWFQPSTAPETSR